jgi:hypothetical protein
MQKQNLRQEQTRGLKQNRRPKAAVKALLK